MVVTIPGIGRLNIVPPTNIGDSMCVCVRIYYRNSGNFRVKKFSYRRPLMHTVLHSKRVDFF